MKLRISALIFSGSLLTHSALFAQKSLVLVDKGNPNATIVISADAPPYIKAAATDLQWHIKLSTGVNLPLMNDNDVSSIPKSHVKLAVGPSQITVGKTTTVDLRFEEFRIKTDLASQTIMMVANDGPDNPATNWAVCELLEQTIGAKWLWPGELGTYVDEKSTVSTPGINMKWRSPYDFRMFRKSAQGEVKKWLTHHRVATRRDFQENSNNLGWHEKYYKTYPGMFARTPDGSPYTSYWAVKLPKFRLNHLKFFDLMLADYNKQGKPDIYSLYPTDGLLFDSKMIPGEDPKAVYYGEVPVTKPYLEFYKKFDAKINGISFKTRFDILAYSAYFTFPDNYSMNGQNFNVWFVDKKNDTANWQKWQATGARMYLRPNWWNRSSFGPDMTYKRNGEMLKYCINNGMDGFKIDGFKDNWALQGLNYYVMARQLYTKKTIEEIAAEYMVAFGDGAPEIMNYFRQCMINSDGFSDDFLAFINEELDLANDAGFSSVEAIPVMYPDKLRASLKASLDSANLKTSGIEQQRVEWLRAGLRVTDLVSNYVVTALNNPGVVPDSALLYKKIEEIEINYPYSITVKAFDAVIKRKFNLMNVVIREKSVYNKYFRRRGNKTFG